MQKTKILVMTTGGTIEKVYDETDGRLENIENRGKIVKEKIMKRLRLPYTDLEVLPIMSKDSLVMTDQDRQTIASFIEKYQTHKHPIVVLHGTDTMEITARYCYEHLPPHVAVVFSGAMAPLGMEDSDALQNMTEAMLAAKLLPAGYYVAFHGHVFQVPNVRKNRDRRTFESMD